MVEVMSAATADAQRDAARRRTILDAALECFLQFGYSKTSLDDIAKRANLSRPLLYRKYKNKEAIFGAVYDDVFETRFAQAVDIAAGRGSRRDKLTRICELVMVDTWALIADAPMASEFYDACMRVIPEIQDRHDRKLLELTRDLLGAKDVAEVFLLAIEGLFTDQPSVAVLRKRLHLLIDRFMA
jgi:AcrR family transcriptional regulator